MASVAKKPTPKSQKAEPVKAAVGKPAPELVAANAKATPAGKGSSKGAGGKVAESKAPAATTASKPAATKAVAEAPSAGKAAQAAPAKATKPGKAAAAAMDTAQAAPGKPLPGQVLTDEDILAMPESDYMNEVQLQFFKAKLLAMRAEILDNARETGEHLKENEVFADPNDRATVEEENMLEQRVRDRERKLLKKIEQSLARIESGEYGYCLETGEPIGIPRLLARPTAELSIEAQEKHERMERLYAD